MKASKTNLTNTTICTEPSQREDTKSNDSAVIEREEKKIFFSLTKEDICGIIVACFSGGVREFNLCDDLKISFGPAPAGELSLPRATIGKEELESIYPEDAEDTMRERDRQLEMEELLAHDPEAFEDQIDYPEVE